MSNLIKIKLNEGIYVRKLKHIYNTHPFISFIPRGDVERNFSLSCMLDLKDI